jgi:hypothetical protein
MLSKGVKKKPSGAEYRKRWAERENEFEECNKFMNLQKYFMSKGADIETRIQGQAPITVPPANRFKLGVTKTGYNVKEKLECQSDFSEVLNDTLPPNTNDKVI